MEWWDRESWSRALEVMRRKWKEAEEGLDNLKKFHERQSTWCE